MVTTYLRRAYSSFAIHVLDIPPRLLVLLLLPLLVIFPTFLPRGPQSAYYLSILITANIYAIFAASWDLLVGRCGQFSLGHALFFGVGAYTTGLLWKYYGLPLWATIPLGTLAGVLVALLVGFPSLRVKGPYLALVSMAFPLILTGVVFYFRTTTGGENGLQLGPTARFFPRLAGYDLRVAEYYLTLLLLLVCSIILYKIANSKTGIVFISILDDELASKACGINVAKYKLMAFAISALFASLAGAVYAHLLTAATISMLSLTLSFAVVIMTILGGMGTIYGPIVGTYIYFILRDYILVAPPVGLVDIPQVWKVLILIIPVVIFIIKWPRGIARFATDELADFAEEREIEERGKRIWKKYKKKEK